MTGDYSIILGGGKTQGKQQQDVLFLGFTLDSQSNSIEEENGYIYFQHEPVEGFQYLLGVSTERYSVSGDLNIDDSEVNPKFGVSWQASDKTSLRLSYFENYRRSLLNDQTIEPVTINGFNQFYTEPVRSKSEQYSLGVDYRFNSRWYAGLELTDRSIDVPYFIASVENIANWKEFVGSAYINWVPSHQFAVRAGYEYEDFDRDELDIAEQGYEKVKTHRLPLKISMFRGDYAAEFDVAYVRQEGEFVDQVTFVADPGSDNFWVADAKFSYLLKGGKGRLVAGVKNIFNENFRYQDTDPNHPRFAFERLGYVSLNLMF